MLYTWLSYDSNLLNSNLLNNEKSVTIEVMCTDGNMYAQH